MKTPSFWKNKTLLSTALLPAGWIYAGLTALRLKLKKPCHAAIPVICVGNLTAGGSGKTPTAVSLAGILKRGGKNPFFVVLRIGYDSILVFYLFSYLFVRDLPVQGNPVQVNTFAVK